MPASDDAAGPRLPEWQGDTDLTVAGTRFALANWAVGRSNRDRFVIGKHRPMVERLASLVVEERPSLRDRDLPGREHRLPGRARPAVEAGRGRLQPRTRPCARPLRGRPRARPDGAAVLRRRSVRPRRHGGHPLRGVRRAATRPGGRRRVALPRGDEVLVQPALPATPTRRRVRARGLELGHVWFGPHEGIWPERTPLTVLFELILASATPTSGIEAVHTFPDMAFIRRSAEPLDPDAFDVSTCYGDRGRALITEP